MARYNLADGNPARASADAHVMRQMRLQFGVLYRPAQHRNSTVGAACDQTAVDCSPATIALPLGSSISTVVANVDSKSASSEVLNDACSAS